VGTLEGEIVVDVRRKMYETNYVDKKRSWQRQLRVFANPNGLMETEPNG
jgi:hypothetical protein